MGSNVQGLGSRFQGSRIFDKCIQTLEFRFRALCVIYRVEGRGFRYQG